MSTKIMVPVDGSKLSEEAVPYAADLAAQLGGELHLVHVQTLVAIEPFSYLSQVADTLARTTIIGGPVIDALTKFISDQRIDVVVMATHGRSGLARTWMGSVADELVRRVSVPVVLLRPGDAQFNTRMHFDNVLIPTDGSEQSDEMVETTLNLLGKSPHYTLFEVTPMPAPIAFADGVPIPSIRTYEEMREQREVRLNELANSLRAQGYNVDAMTIVAGDIAMAIRDHAKRYNVDFVAMVTAGRSGWKRLLVGSVASKLIHDSPVPLMLLKADASRRSKVHGEANIT